MSERGYWITDGEKRFVPAPTCGVSDPVNRPAHYVEGRKYEPRKVIQDWNLCWELGDALKYIARAGRKDNEAQDIRKAITYLQFRLERLEGEGK